MSAYLIVALVFTFGALVLANLFTYLMTKNEKLPSYSKRILNTDTQYLILKSNTGIVVTSTSPFTLVSDKGFQVTADAVQNREPWEDRCFIIKRVLPAGNWKRLSGWLGVVQFLHLYFPEHVDGYIGRKYKGLNYFLFNFVICALCGFLIYLALSVK